MLTVFVVEVLGWIGVLLYVIAYLLVSADRVTGRSPSYQTLNLVGAFGVAANAFYYGAYPSAAVNVIWFAIAAVTLLGVARARRGRDPAQPVSREGRIVLRLVGLGGALLAIFGLGLAIIALMPRPERPMQPVFVFTQDWEPYVGRSLPGGGPLSEMVSDLLRAANYEAQFVFTDWDDALAKVESGVGAAAFPFIQGSTRADRVLFSDPLLHFDYVLFYRRGLTTPTGERDEAAVRAWLDLEAERGDGGQATTSGPASWRLGAVEGYALWPALAEVATVDVTFASPAEAFRALARGDVEFVAEGALVGMRTLQDPVTDVDASRILAAAGDDARTRSQQALHLVTRQGAGGRRLLDRLNARLAELGDRGELDALHARLEAMGRGDVEVTLAEVTEARRAYGNDAGGADSAGDARTYRLPAGTRGRVLRWPSGFDDPTPGMPRLPPPAAEHEGSALVKILNGPLRGWEVLLDPEALVLVGQEEFR